MKMQMFREGARLQYQALIPRIVDNTGPLAFEEKVTDEFLKEVTKKGGVNVQLEKRRLLAIVAKPGSFRTCLKVAEILDLIGLEGTSRGTRRTRLARSTGFGRSIYLGAEMFDSKDLSRLSIGQMFLFLRKFVEFEKEWKGGWAFKLLEICGESWAEENDLIKRFCEYFTVFKHLSSRSKHHRIFPRIQWLYDLNLFQMDNRNNERWYKRSERGDGAYRLWKMHFVNIPFRDLLGLYYRTEDEVNESNTDFEEEFPKFYSEVRNHIPVEKLPLVAIEVLINLFAIKKAMEGYILSEAYFLSSLHALQSEGKASLLTSPSDRVRGFNLNGTIYKLVSLKRK